MKYKIPHPKPNKGNELYNQCAMPEPIPPTVWLPVSKEIAKAIQVGKVTRIGMVADIKGVEIRVDKLSNGKTREKAELKLDPLEVEIIGPNKDLEEMMED